MLTAGVAIQFKNYAKPDGGLDLTLHVIRAAILSEHASITTRVMQAHMLQWRSPGGHWLILQGTRVVENYNV